MEIYRTHENVKTERNKEMDLEKSIGHTNPNPKTYLLFCCVANTRSKKKNTKKKTPSSHNH